MKFSMKCTQKIESQLYLYFPYAEITRKYFAEKYRNAEPLIPQEVKEICTRGGEKAEGKVLKQQDMTNLSVHNCIQKI